MQGRLSDRPGSRLQAFPEATWEREFALARQVGFDCIEWVLETAPGPETPLWSDAGRRDIRRAIDQSGVSVSSICADYFMDVSLGSPREEVADRAVSVMRQLVSAAADVGARRILVPLVEQAALPTEEARNRFRHGVRRCLSAVEQCRIVLALEMEIPGQDYADFVASLGHPLVRACYDTGNSTAQGFDVGIDVVPVVPFLDAIHVKDRVVRGTSKTLGTGDTNFRGLFAALRDGGFAGDVISQHYFGADPLVEARRAHDFIRNGLGEGAREVA
ncbi:MAG TPA: sugar phosphate isomerase/epimerase family protein [Polyangiaceae bacterium]|nr:sugar phosphate isomerase/epimerase family protein [Polyangiaceae bacterium]